MTIHLIIYEIKVNQVKLHFFVEIGAVQQDRNDRLLVFHRHANLLGRPTRLIGMLGGKEQNDSTVLDGLQDNSLERIAAFDAGSVNPNAETFAFQPVHKLIDDIGVLPAVAYEYIVFVVHI